jgi:hypothetical protein
MGGEAKLDSELRGMRRLQMSWRAAWQQGAE